MTFYPTITIIQSDSGKRQVQYARFVIGEFDDQEQAISFAKSYEFGQKILVWKDGEATEILK